jgi:NAD(P)-dependent dehydrogenase (short-subunit alcohol dehydrogenase family)
MECAQDRVVRKRRSANEEMKMAKWTVSDMPDLSGKIAVVTGANSGLGLETTRALAGKGAHVVMACRTPSKAETAAQDVRTSHPQASLELSALDLASLASVRAFAERTVAKHPRIDLLINNAGIMAVPYRKTEDGFESQIGTNHFGHFVLSALLWDALEAAPAARLVNVASQAHKIGKMDFDDLAWERSYAKWPAYGMSKLANLLFSYELSQRAISRGSKVLVMTAHPGYAATNLQAVGPELSGSAWLKNVMGWANAAFAQSAAMGALPQLYAATAPGVQAGDYIGPGGFFGARGYPARAEASARASDAESARLLWERSEALTGTRFPV